MKLSRPQLALLARLASVEKLEQNGRARRTIEILEGYGLLEITDLNFIGESLTALYTIRITATGRFHLAVAPKPWGWDFAGLIDSKVNRETGTRVSVYDGVRAGIEDDPRSKWCTVCEDHGLIVAHPSLQTARYHASNPLGWCEGCRDALEEGEGKCST